VAVVKEGWVVLDSADNVDLVGNFGKHYCMVRERSLDAEANKEDTATL